MLVIARELEFAIGLKLVMIIYEIAVLIVGAVWLASL